GRKLASPSLCEPPSNGSVSSMSTSPPAYFLMSMQRRQAWSEASEHIARARRLASLVAARGRAGRTCDRARRSEQPQPLGARTRRTGRGTPRTSDTADGARSKPGDRTGFAGSPQGFPIAERWTRRIPGKVKFEDHNQVAVLTFRDAPRPRRR